MNNYVENQTIEDLKEMVDALALATRVSRHSEFRFVYFGEEENYENRVRHLIKERLIVEDRLQSPLMDTDIEILVQRFLQKATPAKLTHESIQQLKTGHPRVWGEIAC